MKIIDIIKLVTSIILCQLAGFLGSLFTTPAILPSHCIRWFCALSDCSSLLDSLNIQRIDPLDEIVPYSVKPKPSLHHFC
jgi:hypothetical protein